MNRENSIVITIVVLTYNRRNVLKELLTELRIIQRENIEIVVVDNGSQDGTKQMVKAHFPLFRLISLKENIGVAARNRGISGAKGNYVITIDDDILGLDSEAINHLITLFEHNRKLGAICFKVVDYYTGEICNWCHPKRVEEADLFLETTEISEGAVAFRREIFNKAGLYPECFFISHEGADLAARIIDRGYSIFYTPRVTVRHKYARESRDRWRRYYYDTRNSIWLAVRNYRFFFGAMYILKRIAIMFFYSVRDGYLRYWLKAIIDATFEFPEMVRQRNPISVSTQQKIYRIDKGKPGMVYYLRKRLFSNQVRI